jgi:hypothetical protein
VLLDCMARAAQSQACGPGDVTDSAAERAACRSEEDAYTTCDAEPPDAEALPDVARSEG